MSIPKIENLTKALPSNNNNTDGKASIKDIKESPTATGIPLYQITLNGSSKIFNGVGVAFSKGIPDNLKPEDLVKHLQALSSGIANGKTEKVQEALEKLPGAVLTYSKDGNNLIAYSDKGEAIGFPGRVGKLHEADNPLIKGFDTLKAENNNNQQKISDTFSSSNKTIKPPAPQKLT